MSNCDSKVKYRNFTEANKKKNEMLRRQVFSTLVSYWCAKHNCVHIGHNYRMSKRKVLDRELKQLGEDNRFDFLID